MNVAGVERREGSPDRILLVVTPNADYGRDVRERLNRDWTVHEAASGAAALSLLQQVEVDVLLLDRWLPDLDSEELVLLLRQRYAELQLFELDSQTRELLEPAADQPGVNIELARSVAEKLQRGPARLAPLAADAGAISPLPAPAQNEALCRPLPGMSGQSEAMQRIYRLVRLVAARDTAVLLTGESGTGKELLAQSVHQLSRRASQPLVIVNCAAIPESLLEAELFGYVRGAFTGAMQARIGRIHAAHRGTLFLDEIGELPLSMQSKLLRFLQNGEVQRLGSTDVFQVDVRVIAATNVNLLQRAAEGQFRQDLYYRLCTFPIDLPPLRQRRDDILLLAQAFLEQLAAAAGQTPPALHPTMGRLLQSYNWPGNVRELQHTIERAYILAEAAPELTPEHFPFLLQQFQLKEILAEGAEFGPDRAFS